MFGWLERDLLSEKWPWGLSHERGRWACVGFVIKDLMKQQVNDKISRFLLDCWEYYNVDVISTTKIILKLENFNQIWVPNPLT